MNQKSFDNLMSLLSCGLLVVIGISAYSNNLDGPFIYDDDDAIVNNLNIRQLWPPTLNWWSTEQTSVCGRPVIAITLAINYALDGLEVRGYHIVNIAVHIMASLALFGVIRLTLAGKSLKSLFGPAADVLAWVCALFWLVHPLQTECVNYITQRTESIMGLFYLLTLYCAIRAAGSSFRYPWVTLSVLCCALGMLSKETMVTAPMMVVFYDFVFKSGPVKDMLRKRLILYYGLFSTWLIIIWIMISGPRSETVGFSMGASALSYAMNQCVMIVNYLRLCIWPHPLALDYGESLPITFVEAAPSILILALVLIAALIMLKVKPKAGFLCAWVFIILSPTSSFVPIVSEVGAERRMYLPLAGVIVLFTIGGYLVIQRLVRILISRGLIVERRKTYTIISIVPALMVSAILITLTVNRNKQYRTELSIWQSAVDARPMNYRAHTNLGAILTSMGRLKEATSHYTAALQIKPDFLLAHNNLGVALLKQENLKEAIIHFSEALRIDPYYTKAHYNKAKVLAKQGKHDEAISHYKKALNVNPEYAEAHNNLGILLTGKKNFDEAIFHFNEATRINPHDAGFRDNLKSVLIYIDNAHKHYNNGLSLYSKGQIDNSIAQYRKAIQIYPDYVDAYVNLGAALLSQSKLGKSLKHFYKALQINPNNDKVHNNIGIALCIKGDFKEAIKHFNEALRINPDSKETQKNLKLALRETEKNSKLDTITTP